MAPRFAPLRRYLESVTLPRSAGWPGAFCCKWEGFERGWKWAYDGVENAYASRSTPMRHWKPVERIGASPGVYVFLTRDDYVLYVGKARALQERIRRSLDAIPQHRAEVVKRYAVCQTLSTKAALKIERALIYYYVPPWNRAVGHKLPERRGASEAPGPEEGTIVASAEVGDELTECPRCHRKWRHRFCGNCEVAL